MARASRVAGERVVVVGEQRAAGVKQREIRVEAAAVDVEVGAAGAGGECVEVDVVAAAVADDRRGGQRAKDVRVGVEGEERAT
jgi:hypothetical protein